MISKAKPSAKRARKQSQRHIEPLEVRQLLSSVIETVTPNIIALPDRGGSAAIFDGYTPAEIREAYGFTSVSATGAGETIAIVDAYRDPNIVSDLNVFDEKYGLSNPTLNQYSQTGGSITTVRDNASWASEIALDVEWAHAIAPGATIDLVEASSDSTANLLAAVNEARNLANVSVVSMSWGASEFASETADDKYFTTPAGHIGVTFVAASGDDGAAAGAEWPASSPNVLAVGGTTLTLTSSGAYSSETAWSDSEGGASIYEKTPSYQTDADIGTTRTTPDVSYDADPNTGLAVYDTYGDNGWTVYGGTSAGTPQWAALVALADQERVAKGEGTLDGATGTLPAIYSLYSSGDTSSTYTAAFHDITTGSSGGFGGGGFGGGGFGGGGFPHGPGMFARGRGGGFGGNSVSATTGYDELTGLGTPKAADVVAALVSYDATVTTATTKTTTLTRTERRRLEEEAAAAVSPAIVQSSQPVENQSTIIIAHPVIAALATADPQTSTSPQSMLENGAASNLDVQANTDAATPTVAVPAVTGYGSSAGLGVFTTAADTSPLLTMLDTSLTSKAISTSVELLRMDAIAALGNTVAALSHEVTEAMMTPSGGGSSATQAGASALGVLAADAVLVGQWRRRRKESGSAQAAKSVFSLVPITSEALE